MLETVAVGASVREIGAEVYRAVFAAGGVETLMLTLHGSNGRCGPFLAAPQTSDYVLQKNDVFTFSQEVTGHDWYWVEHARIFALGEFDPEFDRLAATGRDALRLFEEVAVPGATGGEVYRAIDELVTTAGFHQGHTPGHGLGQDVLELPRIAPYDETLIEERMVIVFHPHVLDEQETMSAYQGHAFVVRADRAEPLSRLPTEPVRLGSIVAG